MDFRVKCAVQWVFSYLPKGEKLNYLFQKYYSGSLFDNNWFSSKIEMARKHLENFSHYNRLKNNSHKYYEFGAGWDLIIPVYMGLNGFDVLTIDIRRLVFPELINKAILNFIEHKDDLAFDFELNDLQNPITSEKKILGFIREQCNVSYKAPCDARNTGLVDNSIDFISSTATFEHIPENDIRSILKESYRILKKGGVISAKIDYRDHWAFFDNSISYYNYLAFTDYQWKKYNPPIHNQNRLRHKDYLKLISESGFEIVDEKLTLPDDEQRSALNNIKLAREFIDYSKEELQILQSTIIMIK